jgi:hypothetical protein
MAMESDCVSFQTSLASSDEPDSSQLSTPELTPPSSCASTDGSESSFFSALSHNADSLHPAVGVKGPQHPIIDSPSSEMGFPVHVEFPSKIPGISASPSPLPLHDTSLPSSPTSRRPRKLRKSRPYVPTLSLDSSIAGTSKSPVSSTPQSRHQRPPLTSPIIPHRPNTPGKFLKRSRRSSLPSIPSATFYLAEKRNSGVLDDDSSENLRAVRFVTPRGVSFITWLQTHSDTLFSF